MKTPFSSKSKFIWIASLTLAGIGGFTLRVLNADYFAPADTCEEVVRYMSGCSLSCSDSGPVGRYSCEKSIDEPGMQETVCTRHPYNPAITGRSNGLYESSYQLGNCTVTCGGGHAMCKGDAPVRTGSVPPSITPPTTEPEHPSGPTEGTITYNGYVIMDRNLGASQVCTSLTDTDCYGNYYQRGNNNGFPDSSKGTASAAGITTSATRVAATAGYSSSTWITADPWMNNGSANRNAVGDTLRGGTLDTTSANGAGTTSADRQGPCPTGFHVPSTLERKNMLNGANPYILFSTLKLPLAGARDYFNASPYNVGSRGYYWSSSPYTSANYAYHLYFYSSNVGPQDYNYRSYGSSVRCFQNS